MNAPKIENRLSMGNIITICVLLVGLAGAWFKFEGRLNNLEHRADTQKTQITKLQEERDDNRDRLTRVEVTLGEMRRLLEGIARRVGVFGNAQ